MEKASTVTQPDPRDQKRYYFHNTLLRSIITAVIRLVFRLFANIKVSGLNNLPSQGGVILAANHLTNFDVFPMQLAIPRLIFYMSKEELFRNPIIDLVLRQLGAFPVRRGSKDEWVMRHAARILEQGQVLGIFPEGTRSKSRGLQTAKTGTARLAIESRCPVVLMAIEGTQRMFSHFPRRTPLRVSLSEPIYPRDNETFLELTDCLMFTLADMLPPEMRGVYAQRPLGFED